MTGRRASDWLTDVPRPQDAGDRRAQDRRTTDRRAPRRTLDTLFAASLINQVRPAAETLARDPYIATAKTRAGIITNIRA